MPNLLPTEAVETALSKRDLSNPRLGQHALQQLVTQTNECLTKLWKCELRLHRSCPVVALEDNYDRLGYPPDGAARDARYTRYITPNLILRTQTSAAIPNLLESIASSGPNDVLLSLPGMVYRRDSIDKLHAAEPHQLDLWRLVKRSKCVMSQYDLNEMVGTILKNLLPDIEWRCIDSPHPYTENGIQIDVNWDGLWIEIGECGLANTELLRKSGLAGYSGLAMGLGLDRLLMVKKGIPDIRLLRSDDPRIAMQMLDLNPYREVSSMPPIQRDLSICVDQAMDVELIGDRVREQLPEADLIEDITIQSETAYAELPQSAHERMGMLSSHKNILLRVTIRSMDRTLTDEEANRIRNSVYIILHEGSKQELA